MREEVKKSRNLDVENLKIIKILTSWCNILINSTRTIAFKDHENKKIPLLFAINASKKNSHVDQMHSHYVT